MSNETILQCVLHWLRWPTCRNPYNAHFDVNVALSRYIPVTLSVDFRCPDSKVSRLVCSHIQNTDVLTYQTSKFSFTYYQRHSFTLDQFRNIFSRFSSLTGALRVYIRLKKYDCAKFGKFISKKCKVSFLLSIYTERKVNAWSFEWSIVQFIFIFLSFEISENILRNQKFIYV